VVADDPCRSDRGDALRPQDAGLRPGDLVRIRSGGPLMTVQAVNGDQIVTGWATEDGRVTAGTFNVADLTKMGGLEPPPQSEGPYHHTHCPSDVAINGWDLCLD
jgi:hypothetical protein